MKNYTKSVLVILIFLSVKGYSLPILNSFDSAKATIFIDFDGHRVTSSGWNGGYPFNCAPAPLTDLQMIEIFNRVAEDYRPFNVNITTDSVKFLLAPLNRRIRIIVTPTSAWSPGVGGVAYIGSFVWGDDTPAFVFTDRLNNSPKYIGECVSHESGHTVGLAHQSSYNTACALTEPYATGQGSGETGWAPIMGNSYYRNMTGWNYGPTPYGCSNVQDNLTIISSQNGFTYRTDDYTATLNSNTEPLTNLVIKEGVIATNLDTDAFKYEVSQNSTVFIEVTPFRLNSQNTGANLDVEVELYNSSNELLRTYAPTDKMNVVIDTILNTGIYYLIISGTGNMNTAGYGSLGSYTLSAVGGALPIRNVTLHGKVENKMHKLNWTIVADEPIKSQVIEASVNGTDYSHLSTVDPLINDITVTPATSGNFYYRLKVTSVLDQVAYSNIIALNSLQGIKQYRVSSVIQNEITIMASDNFEYMIADANGRLLKKGKGNTGMNNINMSQYPSGMYIMQIVNHTAKQTERIIKQ